LWVAKAKGECVEEFCGEQEILAPKVSHSDGANFVLPALRCCLKYTMLSLYQLFKVVILFINALAILNERRFLAPRTYFSFLLSEHLFW
jgi:hypothetical protein